jgi:hypothetical protein
MFGSALLREKVFADKALANVLSDDNENLADLVGARGVRVSPGSIVSSHCRSAMSHEGIDSSPACLG